MRDKQELREALRTRRAALPGGDRDRRTELAVGHLLGLPELQAPGTVALYAAVPGEIDPAPARPTLEARGARIVLPRVHGDGHLELVAAQGALSPGFRGVLEPDGPAVPPGDVDVIVVPGVAFDLDGGRLGQGGGHYDRLLSALGTSTTAVGFAFGFQVVQHVPLLDHDRPVDIVVTDEGVRREYPRGRSDVIPP